MSKSTVAYVTRISSGIVPVTTEMQANHGNRALHTARCATERRPRPGVDGTEIEGRDDASRQRGVKLVIDGPGRGGARVSNAGVVIGGAAEETMSSKAASLSNRHVRGISDASVLREPS